HGLSDDAFSRWTELKHPVLIPDASPLRLERETALSDLPPALAAAFAGVECSWWASLADFDTAWAARRPDAAAAFIEQETITGMLVREEPVLWPQDRFL
ncbi:MAG: hypothetical protein D6782_07565, partial [Alphaproteobacteria bacterium]